MNCFPILLLWYYSNPETWNMGIMINDKFCLQSIISKLVYFFVTCFLLLYKLTNQHFDFFENTNLNFVFAFDSIENFVEGSNLLDIVMLLYLL